MADSARGLVRAVPAWAWLSGIVVLSAIFRAVIGRGIEAPFIFVDELIWAELARGLGDAGEPQLRGAPNPGYSLVYPALLSPLYAAFDTLPSSYEAVKAFNGLLMSLAAVPAYALARRLVGTGLALLAALLTVAIPSLAYTGTVMTENAFYPLFLLVALLLVLVLERPTALPVVLLVVTLGVAYATRVQAAVLVLAALLSPLVLALFERRGLRATFSRYRVLYGAFLALAALALLVQLARGRSPGDLLGAYSPVGDADYELGEVLRYLVWHAAELVLYVLVVPVVATVVLLARARSLDRPLQAHLAVTLAIAASLLPSAAAFASVFSLRIQERNLFYLAPLLVVCLLAWVDRGAPRPRALAVTAAVASALAVLLIPFDRFITTSAVTDTLMLLPFWSLQDRIGMDWIAPAALALAATLAAAFLFVPRRLALVLPLLVLGLWAAAFKPIWWGKHGFEQAGRGALFQGIREAKKDWIDRALPPDAAAAFLWTGRTDRLTVNQSEFFNRGVGAVYYVLDPTPGHLPETRVEVDEATGQVTLPGGEPVTDGYLLADSSFEPVGTVLGRDPGWGIVLWQVTPPLVSATRVEGLYSNDTWSGEAVTYLRRRCGGGRLLLSLSSDASLFSEPVTVAARVRDDEVARVTFEPGEHTVLAVPMTPAPGTDECRATFRVSPTAVPAEVTDGENPDPRVLGAHFDRFRFVPAT